MMVQKNKPVIWLVRKCVHLFLFLGFAGAAGAQNYAGTDFRVSFLQNIPPDYSGLPTFYFSGFAIEDAEIEIAFSIPGNPEYLTQTVSAAAGESFSSAFNNGFLNQENLNIKEFRSFHITSTGLIRLYATHFRSFYSEGSAVLPTDQLGTQYTVINLPATVSDSLGVEPSICAIIGTEDSTLVEIILTGDTPLGAAGSTLEIYLDDGEVISLASFPAGAPGTFDLTGTRISTPNGEKIAVFAGNRQRFVICGAADNHLFEQMLPQQYWSTDYPVITGIEGLNLIRIVAAEDGTDIYYGCVYMATINVGEFYELKWATPTIFTGSAPIFVALFQPGLQCNNLQRGDPNMRVPLPVERGNLKLILPQPFEFTPIGNENGYYVMHLVTNAADAPNVLVNGSPPVQWIPFQQPGDMVYARALLNPPPATNTVESITPFWAEYMALGSFDAITMSAGSEVEMIYSPNIPGSVNLGPDRILCPGDSITLFTNVPSGVIWQDGSTQSFLEITEAGIFFADAVLEVCGSVSDTVVVTVSLLPEFSWEPLLSACENELLVLSPSDDEQMTYFWSTGAGTPTISVAESGTYGVTLLNSDGCAASDTVQVVFSSLGEIAITGPEGICPNTEVVLTANADPGEISWSSGPSGSQITVDTAGVFTASLLTPDGCQSFASFNLFPLPDPFLFVENVTFCLGNSVTVTAMSNAPVSWPGLSETNSLLIDQGGDYLVIAENDCATISQTLIATAEDCDCLIAIPNIFSPNGDQRNDVFLPEFSCEEAGYTLDIYNRWGAIIYSDNQPSRGWDGRISNQEEASDGEYWYVISYRNVVIDTKPLRRIAGSLTLIR